MFKRFTAILLVITLISYNFSLFMVYAGFEMNHKYIADNLCVNKLRPWMHCNGKCYFMKKIKQAADNDKKQQAKDNLNRLEVSFCDEPFRLKFIAPTVLTTERNTFPLYNFQYRSRYIDAIFRPPKRQVA